MLVYVTEHTVAGMTDAHVSSVHAALLETTRRLRMAGVSVRLLECRYLRDERLVCQFAATDEIQVRQALQLAQLPLASVCQVVDADG